MKSSVKQGLYIS